MSPAVITETVWALAHPRGGQPVVIPSEVVVITTTKGAKDLDRILLSPHPQFSGRSVWESLREILRPLVESRRSESDFLQLSAPRVIELPDSRTGVKRPADDIRSFDDNRAAADFILEELRRHVENPETHVIASIAGGRKTMGALLYACMNLLGRETDRVTHVLVDEPYETCREFFYPEQPTQELSSSHRPGPFLARHARIELADLPFVPLRNRFAEFAELPGRFTALAERYLTQLNHDAERKVPVIIDFARQILTVDGVELRIRTRALLVLHYFLDCQQRNCTPPGQIEAIDGFNQWKASHPHGGPGDCGAEEFRHELSHIRTALRKRGSTWQIPVRSLVFPPFELTVR